MAIQVSGTEVISDARALTNITGVTVVGTTSIEEVWTNVSTSATTRDDNCYTVRLHGCFTFYS
jgi:hypothetical protein